MGRECSVYYFLQRMGLFLHIFYYPHTLHEAERGGAIRPHAAQFPTHSAKVRVYSV